MNVYGNIIVLVLLQFARECNNEKRNSNQLVVVEHNLRQIIQFYLNIYVSKEESEIDLKKGEKKTITYTVETNLSPGNTLSLLFDISHEGVINVTNAENNFFVFSTIPGTFTLDIKGITTGITKLFVKEAKAEKENIKYELKRSFVELRVYYSEICHIIAQILGYTFAVCCVLGWVPQILLIQRRKSVAGFELAFLWIEVIDSIIYITYIIGIFFVDDIQEKYFDDYQTQYLPVDVYDVLFATTNMIVFSVISFQYVYFGDGDKRITTSNQIWIALIFLHITINILLWATKIITSFDLFMYMPWVMILIALFKYTPQMVANYHNKSTNGISTTMVILELTVGLAVVLQVVIDVINNNAISLIFGNFQKFFDGIATLFGNLIFLLQIFWYEKNVSVYFLSTLQNIILQYNEEKGVQQKQSWMKNEDINTSEGYGSLLSTEGRELNPALNK